MTTNIFSEATDLYLEEAVAELFMRYARRAEEGGSTSFGFQAKCKGGGGGNLELNFSVCLNNHYVGSDDPKSANIETAFNEAQHRWGFARVNREGRLLAGPKLEAREQIEAARAESIAAE